MGGRVTSGRRPLVGREEPVALVLDVVRDAAGGRAGAVLVTGAPGIGKTALVRRVCDVSGSAADVHWGGCPPLTSTTVPFAPLVRALHLDPALKSDAAVSARQAVLGIDRLMTRRCRQRPQVLVVDDLQWADSGSLDALTFLLAGPEDRSLAVLLTLRRGEVDDGSHLHRWLADVRRLPGVRELQLGPLTREQTDEQVAGFLGPFPSVTVLEAVHRRTRGNPYLTELLLRDLPPATAALPTSLPVALVDAVALAWQDLSPADRHVLEVLAVAGRPTSAADLGALVRTPPGEVVGAVRRARTAGVLEDDGTGEWWFVHPLLAEVLAARLLPEERRALHGLLADSLAAAEDGPDHAIALADHSHLAGRVDDALRWAVAGAVSAERSGGTAEALRLLRRAADLTGAGGGPPGSRVDLLVRLRSVAVRAGDHEGELAAVEDLLTTIADDPTGTAELLVRRMQLRLSTGRGFAEADDVRRAVALTAGRGDGAVHALALAELAHVEVWRGEPAAVQHAHDALALAERSGDPRATSYACSAEMMVRSVDGPRDDALAARAMECALRADDPWAYVHAALWAGNGLDGAGTDVQVRHLRTCRAVLDGIGAPLAYTSHLAACEAEALLVLGDWRGCATLVRTVLGSTSGPMSSTSARLTASRLALRQGRVTEARAHLDRAEEVFATTTGFLAFGFALVRAELALALGETDEAVRHALQVLQAPGVAPTGIEHLLPVAARALADRARTGGVGAAAALLDLRDRFPEIVPDVYPPGGQYDAQVAALQRVYEAETARGTETQTPRDWPSAAAACGVGGLRWHEAYCWWRAGEFSARTRSARREALAALRRARTTAADLGAVPLLERLADLAASLHAPPWSPDLPGSGTPSPRLVPPGLTVREEEVLALLVSGLTYREIATHLFVSPKTVSVHVSNMLHKTGTRSRVELSQLVRPEPPP